MQNTPPPMTPLEQNLTSAYQTMNQVRMTTSMTLTSAAFCLQRCLDTEELYTLLRTTQAPIHYRHQKDLEEKECVKNCGFKWDETLQRILVENTERATSEVQKEAMMQMMQQMQQAQAQQ